MGCTVQRGKSHQIEKMFSRANADSVERDAEKHMCEFPTSPMSYKSQEDLCMNAGASGYSPVLPDVWHRAWNRCKRGQHPLNDDSCTSIWALRTSAPVPGELATLSPLEKDFSQLSLLCSSANMHSLETHEESLQDSSALFGAFFIL